MYQKGAKNLTHNQLQLFESTTTYKVAKETPSFMSKSALENWKKNIKIYQEKISGYQTQQQCLFSLYKSSFNTENINPFSLTTHPDQFYDLPAYKYSKSCLYFILDTAFPLLLYIGETKQSPNERWTSHDCKSYLKHYIELHRFYQLKVTIRSAFLWGIPQSRKLRQSLEKDLILKWRSPFNKESWHYWGQPFS